MSRSFLSRKSDKSQLSERKSRWAYYVLLAYPVAFVLGAIGILGVFFTTTDPTMFSAGLTSGYLLLGLSVLAFFTYPAVRLDLAPRQEQSKRSMTFRRYLMFGLGFPLAIGLLIDVGAYFSGGSLGMPGLLTVFVFGMLHPVAVFFATIGYLWTRNHQGS